MSRKIGIVFAKSGAIHRRAVLKGAAGAAIGIAAGWPRPLLAQTREKLAVLVATAPPDPASHYYFYAQENGFYEKHGLDVTLRPITAESTTIRALIAGEGDVAAFCGVVSPLQAYSSGSPIRLISTFAPKLDYQIIASKSIANIKGLEGHSFAVSQVGTVSQFVPSLMMKKIGADPKQVRWASVGNSAARLQAVIAKSVEAAAVNASLAIKGKQYDYLHIIGNAGDVLPEFLYGCDVTTAAIGAKRKSAMQAFVAACGDGVRWAASNPDKAVAVSQKVLPNLPKEDVATAIKYYIEKKFWHASGILPEATWDFTVKAANEGGLIKVSPSYADFVLPLKT